MMEYLLLINSVLVIGLGIFIYRENKKMKYYINNRFKKPLIQNRKL